MTYFASVIEEKDRGDFSRTYPFIRFYPSDKDRIPLFCVSCTARHWIMPENGVRFPSRLRCSKTAPEKRMANKSFSGFT